MLAPLNTPVRVMLLDDHEFILHGMAITLSAAHDIRIMGSFTQGQQLTRAMKEQVPDVVVLDYCLRPGEVDGVNLIRGLRIRHPQVRLLVLSSLHTPSTVALAMRCGASGFIGKELASDRLATAIRTVAAGQIFMCPAMAARLAENDTIISEMSSGPTALPPARINVSQLTNREHEVLRCCLDGLSVTQISEKFSRSVKTISAQKQSAFRKLGLRNNHELFNLRVEFEGWR